MRIVVTGATGNVGTSVVAALAEDERVTEIVGVARRRPPWQPPRTTWVEADVVSSPLTELFRDAAAVIHLAWMIQPSRDEALIRRTNVDGSERVFAAAAEAGAGALVHASSIGVYSPAQPGQVVSESWPAEGTPTSFYARHKAAAERALDVVEQAHPRLRVVRLRPGLIFKREAASEIRRLFAGRLLPPALVRPERLPVLPLPAGLRVQAVHCTDVADAYRRAALDDTARGAYNVAAPPVLDAAALGRALGARPVELPVGVVRAAAALTYRLHVHPSEPGWLDMGMGVPVMDTTRIREELGWAPAHTADAALLELIRGVRDRAGGPTPPLKA